jgi:hypothetical protein
VSEIGSSLHFWRAGRDDAREFVVRLRAAGRIVASNDRWTCFVPFDREDEARLAVEWSGTVLRWSYSGDYGLGVDFCRDGSRCGQMSFIWGTALTGQPPGGTFERELRSVLLDSDVLSAKNADDLERVLADVAAGSSAGKRVRDHVAEILGLAAFEWLSPEICLEVSLEDARKDYPDAEDVETP